MKKPKKNPQWTVLYNIKSLAHTDWVGTGWEFFDAYGLAKRRYKELSNDARFCPALRPFDFECDNKHLGAAHTGRK